jgi:hypothetical protein
MRFDMNCEANGIEHRLTKPNHPWTNGQVERMNRTIKDATVKRFHYDTHNQLKTHLADFMAAYNFARRLKTLGGLTPYEYICKIWTSEPDRFILNPIHQMPGLNSSRLATRVSHFRHTCRLRDRCPSCGRGLALFSQKRLVPHQICALFGAALCKRTRPASAQS